MSQLQPNIPTPDVQSAPNTQRPTPEQRGEPSSSDSLLQLGTAIESYLTKIVDVSVAHDLTLPRHA